MRVVLVNAGSGFFPKRDLAMNSRKMLSESRAYFAAPRPCLAKLSKMSANKSRDIRSIYRLKVPRSCRHLSNVIDHPGANPIAHHK